jgi:signal recognition particle subunit SRP72
LPTRTSPFLCDGINTDLSLNLQDLDEQQDIITNLNATTTHLEFQQTRYAELLRSTPGVQSISALEAFAPSFPVSSTSVATQAQASKTSTSNAKGKGKAAEGKSSKPRHKLPKGAVLGQKFEEDVSTHGCMFDRER